MSEAFTLKTHEEQLAQELRRRIARGEWSERLPGQRALMARFGVSRPLLEKALVLLKASGDIEGGGVRSAYRAVRRPAGGEGAGTVLVYSLAPEQTANEATRILEALLSAMPAPHERLRLDPLTPPEVVASRVLALGVRNALVAFLPVEAAEALASAGVRAVMFGGGYRETCVPVIGTDYPAILRGAFRRAFAAGHTRVCAPVWRKTPGFAARVRALVAEEYARAGLKHSPAFDVPVVESRDPSGMHECVRELFRHTPPTALILHEFPQWMAAASMLAHLRLRVPEEVSTILLLDAPELHSATPTQAHFRQDAPKFVPALREVLLRLERGQPTPPRLIAPVWVPGGSLAPPASQRA